MTKILCIEDEHFISELYGRALAKAGYEPKIVFDGSEGVIEALSGQYDIILLDLMLPGMSGVEILNRLRGKEVEGKIKSKIIITTNLVEDDETRARIEQLADGYLIKAEFTPKELVTFLQQLKLG